MFSIKESEFRLEIVMEYRIERVKAAIEGFEDIGGMEVLTYVLEEKKYIDGPINLEDYDKYYEWLRKETNKWNISVSDNLEDFKREFTSDPGIFVPGVFQEDALENLKMATLEDILKYNSEFDKYFKEVECC